MVKRAATTAAGLKSKQKYPQEISQEVQVNFSLKTKLKAKNYSQELYLESLRNNTITIGRGPAGAGKTFLVTYVALEKLMKNEIDRIVLTRPVVEAGENLGFLPGDFKEKLHPYLLPLIDSIEDHVGPMMAKKLMEAGKIEIAPLAFMRGRTFNNAFVILDEAQNTKQEQMRMFLTRIGFNTQMCINGDSSQSDLGLKFEDHGLDWLTKRIVGKMSEINVVEFSNRDIVRNPLIARILTYLDAPQERPTALKKEPTPADVKISGKNGQPFLVSPVVPVTLS